MHVRWSVVAVVITMLALQFPSIAVAGSDGRVVAMPTLEQANPHRGGGGSTNLSSHGGAVETTPAVYINYWGPEWATGFTTGGHPSTDAQTYVNAFFSNTGGSSWINSTSQYCQDVPSGTVVCSTQSSAQYIGNPQGQLVGVWNDPTPVPSRPSQSDIANAAIRLASHFVYNPNATYLVFTPSGKSTPGFGTRFCAWHSSTTVSGGSLAYANMPYQPDAGTSCGMNFVNKATGYFDGFSIVGGHEYAEAQTDPFPNGGWLDGSGAENGDKCAWISSGQGAATNVTLGGQSFAVQSLWSNASNNGAGGCVTSY